MNTTKRSKQREAIKNFLYGRKDHPTAEFIYQNLREELPNLSLGTVYRNLALLEQLGEICRISCGDSSDHFDYNTKPHHHFICRQCHCVQDIPIDNLDFLTTLASANFNGNIEGYHAHFYGLCKECATAEN